jgi:hypothetical protein
MLVYVLLKIALYNSVYTREKKMYKRFALDGGLYSSHDNYKLQAENLGFSYSTKKLLISINEDIFSCL